MTDLFFWNIHKPTCLDDIKHNGRNIILLKKFEKRTENERNENTKSKDTGIGRRN